LDHGPGEPYKRILLRRTPLSRLVVSHTQCRMPVERELRKASKRLPCAFLAAGCWVLVACLPIARPSNRFSVDRLLSRLGILHTKPASAIHQHVGSQSPSLPQRFPRLANFCRESVSLLQIVQSVTAMSILIPLAGARATGPVRERCFLPGLSHSA
jgi:hypothetical protein